LNKTNRKRNRNALYRSRLGLNLLGVILFALALSILLYIGLLKLGDYAVNTAIFNDYVQENDINGILTQFQQFVTDKQIRSDDNIDIQVWLFRNTDTGFYLDFSSKATGEYRIQFADKTVAVTPYISTTKYTLFIQLCAVWIASFCFMLAMLPYIKWIISDIKNLSRDMGKLTSGDLEHRVCLERKDELGDLAQDMDAMRRSVIFRMQRESDARKANQDLITALSHDLRTPLTKQIGYLELALKGQYRDPQAMDECLHKVLRSAEQIKALSDELFSYFIAFDENESGAHKLENVDGATLFGQILMEQSELLESKGFRCDMQLSTDSAFMLNINVAKVMRIVDNLLSNILKYADSSEPVRMFYFLSAGFANLHFENLIKQNPDYSEGTNIGIISAEKLAEEMDGCLSTWVSGNHYIAVFQLPIAVKKDEPAPVKANGKG
jgi:signal transduction histidine kinase